MKPARTSSGLSRFLLLLAVSGTQSPVHAQTASPQTTAFVNVSVVPMDGERVLEAHTVVVRDERIVALGEAGAVSVPDGARVIDGTGAYLIPGLADMHTHLTFDADPNHLLLYLAEGVTTIRDLGTPPYGLEWRERVAAGELLGPTIYLSGPTIVGLPPDYRWMGIVFRAIVVALPLVLGLLAYAVVWIAWRGSGRKQRLRTLRRYALRTAPALVLMGVAIAWLKLIPIHMFVSRFIPFVRAVETVAEARQAVRDYKETGYDLVKVYDFLPQELFVAAAAEAKAQGIYAVAHAPDAALLEAILSSGISEIAHIDEYLSHHWIGFDPAVQAFVPHEIDRQAIPRTVALTKQHDVRVASNLVADEVIYMGLEDPDAFLARPEYRVVRPEALEQWKSAGRFVNWQGQQDYRREVAQPFLLGLIGALHEAQVPLLIGTDGSVEGMVPYHIHRELELLVEAGLSPFEALAAGTRNAAIAAADMNGDGAWGTVTQGNRADLILLAANPLESVGNTRARLGVMVRGRWFTQHELDGRVEEFVRGH